LLDEPTEGLDPDTANRVLNGLRAHLPQAAILLASHRETETAQTLRNVTVH
jgi:ATP-binding cassette subfamily C protein CydC